MVLLAAGAGITWLSQPNPLRYLALLWLLAAAVLYGVVRRQFQNHFIVFRSDPTHQVSPQRLPSSRKLSVLASGHFYVEGKYGHFTWLEGFFRTFPSREHAVICLVQPSRYLFLGRSPEEKVGMWYMFIQPQDLTQVDFGQVHYGPQVKPGLRLQYALTIPKKNRLSRERTVLETVYLAFESVQEAEEAMADLALDLGRLTDQ